ncbi:MAG: DUF5677 domain-containing protein [Bacteroidota bacterium]
MNSEYSKYCSDLATKVEEYASAFEGIQFHEKDQAVEVFAMQSLSMASSSLQAASILLDNNFVPEAILITRPIQELLFNLRWILGAQNDAEKLERVYRLEGDPYSAWQKETKLIREDGERRNDSNAIETAKRFNEPLDHFAEKYSYLVEAVETGTYKFKSAPAFASRMDPALRLKYYHLYRYTSVFAHPTPFTKAHYLKTSNGSQTKFTPEDESIKQSLAYSFLFTDLLVGSAEEILKSFAPESDGNRLKIYSDIGAIVKLSNKNYFSSI